jgi:hypothetical protein
MKAIAVFLLFLGMFLVVQGYYSERYKCTGDVTRIEYVPRTVYEEQLNPSESVSRQFKSMFEDITEFPARGE